MHTNSPNPEISIVVPAYNEDEVIGPFLQKLRQVVEENHWQAEILVVDDGSSDRTAEVARQAGIRLLQHPYNIGYGAALKTGYRHARGKVIVTIDGDGQHNPSDIAHLLALIDRYDMVVGSRSHGSQTALHRDLANSIYNRLASYITRRKIEDLTSGLRAVRAPIVRQFMYLLPNTFSSSATITLSVLRAGYSLAYVPIRVTRRAGKSKSKIRLLEDGLRFLLIILKIAVFFSPLKVFVPLSLVMFLLGVGYGLVRVLLWHTNYGSTSALLISTSVLIFMVGLVSEQIAQLRFDRSESVFPFSDESGEK